MPAPKDYDALWRDVREVLPKMRAFLRNPWANSGLSAPGPGVVQVDGSLVVQSGDAKSGNYAPGSAGWHLPASGAAEFTDIIINGVSVGGDAPVQIDVRRIYAEGFSLTTSYVQKDSLPITVPDGCTRLNAILESKLYAVNQNTTGGSDTNGGDAIYVQATLAGNVTGGSPQGLTGFNGFTTTTSADAFQITGLTPGQTLTLGVECKSGYQPIPAYVDNNAKAVASLTWLR